MAPRFMQYADTRCYRIEDALEMSNIHYERLDGGMKREERNRSMEALKNDPRCEVLLGMSIFVVMDTVAHYWMK